MIEERRGLSDADLQAIAELERRSLAVDGGRLKLEWHVLRRRPTDVVTDVLARDGDRLAGFVGVYAFGGQAVELTGMVDPDLRRRGIGTALLAAARDVCRDRGLGAPLLVTPREPDFAARLARRAGATFEHSEHAMLQREPPPPGDDDPALTMRPAVATDVPDLNRILSAAFGDGPFETTADRLAEASVVVRDGAVVGTLRVQRDGDSAGIYGVAVDPPLQGQGIGRAALRWACRTARADGAAQVRLEVAVENDRALGLYTSLGFERVATEDYWALPASTA